MNMGLIEDTPMGKLIVTNLLAFTEFKRSLIIERTSAGKNQAKVSNPNWREGRPKKFTQEKLDYAMRMMEYETINKLSRITGISNCTLLSVNNKKKNTERTDKLNLNSLWGVFLTIFGINI